MHTITIVALGPGSPDLVTIGALKQMKKAKKLLLRTSRHGVSILLAEENIAYKSLDFLYEQSDDFDAFAEDAVKAVLDQAQSDAVTYAVADPAGDVSVRLLRERVGDQVRILPGVPLSAPFLSSALPSLPLMVSSAADLLVVNAQQPLCVFELDSRVLAGEVKLKLLPKYGEDAQVRFFPPSEASLRKYSEISLTELDRQPHYNHTAGFIILPKPMLERTQFDAEDLLALMRRLRAKEGCPWDREQTHQTLAKYLVEEANEASCALLDEDWEEAADELGDVFLQLAFHAVVGDEYGTFSWEDMLRSICLKLIRRHPHIFGDQKLNTAEEVLVNWDRIKKEERGGAEPGQRMEQVPRGLAPLLRAEKVQKLAAKAGFDWNRPEEALGKVHEEADELLRALLSGRGALEELGDLFFSCVNTARLMGVSADQVIHFATEKFIKRFIWMENAIKNDEKDWNLLTSNEIGVYWERSKAED